MRVDHIPDAWVIKKQGRRIYVFDEHSKARCSYQKDNGKPCMNSPSKGHCRCRFHGSRNKSGKEHGSYTTGKHVGRYAIPTSLSDRYQEMQDDPNILDLKNNLGIIDVRLQQLLNKIENADFGQSVLPQLSKLYYRAERHLRNKDMDKFAETWIDMGGLIQQGSNDYTVWQEIISVNDKRSGMVKKVVDIELAAHRAVSINELMAVLNRMVNAFEDSNELLSAQERKTAFTLEVRKLLNESTS